MRTLCPEGETTNDRTGYMYSGDIDTEGLTNSAQTLLDVLKLADFWGIEDLNLAIQEALVPHIDHNTYFDSKSVRFRL